MPDDTPQAGNGPACAALPLDRDLFLRSLIRELSGTLEDVVGLSDAEGYISVVGTAIGDQINASYKTALTVDALDRAQVGEALVDLKRRIGGDFYLIEEGPHHLVLGNRTCPFGAHVEGGPSLCMMTSNVFGAVAANNLGYARVTIDKAIARGDAECRVVVRFEPTEEPGEGREYFGR